MGRTMMVIRCQEEDLKNQEVPEAINLENPY